MMEKPFVEFELWRMNTPTPKVVLKSIDALGSQQKPALLGPQIDDTSDLRNEAARIAHDIGDRVQRPTTRPHPRGDWSNGSGAQRRFYSS